MLKKQPAAFRPLFVFENIELTWKEIDRIFCIEELAVSGSNLRSKQERAIEYWRDYIIGCSGKFCGFFLKPLMKLTSLMASLRFVIYICK